MEGVGRKGNGSVAREAERDGRTEGTLGSCVGDRKGCWDNCMRWKLFAEPESNTCLVLLEGCCFQGRRSPFCTTPDLGSSSGSTQ